jgi:hypothetical protein
MSRRGSVRHRRFAVGPSVLMALVLAVGSAACTDEGSDSDGTNPTVPPGASPGAGEPSGTAPLPSPTQLATPTTQPAPSVPATAPDGDGDGGVGVPGLDSDEIACRSWSRFAGSFQVVAVAATFGEGGSLAAATLEVMASPVVVGSYRDFLENVPAEVAAESELVARDFLGPYARRSERALGALVAAGADDAMLEVIADAWLDALSRRDSSTITLDVMLPPDVEAVVAAAAADFDAQLVPIPLDPSLVTDVEVPLTERYLSDNCPDRGALAGSEVQN